ncbi:PIN domain-containing protein, partial [Klebsiella pneumoniae]
PRHVQLVDAFCARLDAILAWDRAAVDATTEVKATLAAAGTPIGPNDTAIAGHAIAAGAILVTNNTREFERVAGLTFEDWVQ